MIADQHLWGHQRTVYRDKSVWVVEIFGKAGGASSLHHHEHMSNTVYVYSGELLITDDWGEAWRVTHEEAKHYWPGLKHKLHFDTDVHAYETYFALPGHEIDENDIVRLSPGRAP